MTGLRPPATTTTTRDHCETTSNQQRQTTPTSRRRPAGDRRRPTIAYNHSRCIDQCGQRPVVGTTPVAVPTNCGPMTTKWSWPMVTDHNAVVMTRGGWSWVVMNGLGGFMWSLPLMTTMSILQMNPNPGSSKHCYSSTLPISTTHITSIWVTYFTILMHYLIYLIRSCLMSVKYMWK